MDEKMENIIFALEREINQRENDPLGKEWDKGWFSKSNVKSLIKELSEKERQLDVDKHEMDFMREIIEEKEKEIEETEIERHRLSKLLIEARVEICNFKKLMEEGDYWTERAKQYLSNGNCPICFSTDENGHAKECPWGQDELSIDALTQRTKDFKQDEVGEEKDDSSCCGQQKRS